MKSQLDIHTFQVGSMSVNCYIVSDTGHKQCIVIDPGDDAGYIAGKIESFGTPVGIVLTHGHFDHLMAALEIQMSFGIPCMMNKKDLFLLRKMNASIAHYLGIISSDPPPHITNTIANRDTIRLGSFSFLVIETPGHTPGSVSLYCKKENILFSGDTVFSDGSVGSYQYSYSDKSELDNSVTFLFSYPKTTRVFPGHGESAFLHEIIKRSGSYT